MGRQWPTSRSRGTVAPSPRAGTSWPSDLPGIAAERLRQGRVRREDRELPIRQIRCIPQASALILGVGRISPHLVLPPLRPTTKQSQPTDSTQLFSKRAPRPTALMRTRLFQLPSVTFAPYQRCWISESAYDNSLFWWFTMSPSAFRVFLGGLTLFAVIITVAAKDFGSLLSDRDVLNNVATLSGLIAGILTALFGFRYSMPGQAEVARGRQARLERSLLVLLFLGLLTFTIATLSLHYSILRPLALGLGSSLIFGLLGVFSFFHLKGRTTR